MTQDLTAGKEGRVMLRFALPLIAGDLFQQLYNIADTIIVGRYLGPDALAAVGSSFAVMTFLTSILLGLCMGASVLFSQLFGARETSLLKQSVWTAFVFTGGFTLILNLLAVWGTDGILTFLNMPAEIFSLTKDYLLVIFYGMSFTFLYNFFSSLLRSVGNSMVPLLFLILSALLNIGLDILFIASFQMGIAGAAWATIAAQGLSGLATAAYCFIKLPFLRWKRGELKITGQMLRKIASYSTATSIQQSIMNFGILMVQGLVNSFGVAVMAAFAAAVKIDAFAYMPAQDFGNAFSIYIAQNTGARKADRIHRGSRIAFGITLLFCLTASLAVAIFARPLMTIFIPPEETLILDYGVGYLRIVACFYGLIGFLFLFYGYFRGLGRTGVSILLTIISLGLRVAIAYLFAPPFGVTLIWWAIPIGWLAADLVGLLLLRRNPPSFTPAPSVHEGKVSL